MRLLLSICFQPDLLMNYHAWFCPNYVLTADGKQICLLGVLSSWGPFCLGALYCW